MSPWPMARLGLSTADLNDGSYSDDRRLYRGERRPGHSDGQGIGDFYTQFTGNRCAYDLPRCAS